MKKVFFSTILFGILSTQVHADYLPSQQSTSAQAARYSTMGFNDLLSEAKAGQPAAQFYVATRYQAGREVSKDPHQAFFWYKKAADPERPAAPFASFIPRIVFSVIRAFRFLHNLCFPEARGPFRSAKSTSAAYRSCPTPGLRSLSLRPSGAPSRCSTE